jgi:hypothetical protein
MNVKLVEPLLTADRELLRHARPPAIAPAARAHLFDAHLPGEHPPGSGRAEGATGSCSPSAAAPCRPTAGGYGWSLPVRPQGPLFSGS